MRFLAGLRSWFRRLLEVDWRFAKYAIVGPSPPRIVYVAFLLALTSWAFPAVGLAVVNPVGAVFLATLVLALLIILLFAIVDAPPLRWHFISDDIVVSFRGDPPHIAVAETIDMRAMKHSCPSISYPITDIRGDLTVTRVSEKGVILLQKSADESRPGYVVERLGRENARLLIDLSDPVPFGRKTILVVEWRADGDDTQKIDNYAYAANTVVDHLSITICFDRDRYPAGRIVRSWSFGIKSEESEHLPQRRANEANQICETWPVASVSFQHTYTLRWNWHPANHGGP